MHQARKTMLCILGHVVYFIENNKFNRVVVKRIGAHKDHNLRPDNINPAVVGSIQVEYFVLFVGKTLSNDGHDCGRLAGAG
jgi:hypothetical protein